MNICILKESLDIGGTERAAANTSLVLEGSHNVYVALYNAGNMKYPHGGTLEDLNVPPRKTVVGKVYNTFLRSRKLKRLLKREKIDILYTFTGIVNRLSDD